MIFLHLISIEFSNSMNEIHFFRGCDVKAPIIHLTKTLYIINGLNFNQKWWLPCSENITRCLFMRRIVLTQDRNSVENACFGKGEEYGKTGSISWNKDCGSH